MQGTVYGLGRPIRESGVSSGLNLTVFSQLADICFLTFLLMLLGPQEATARTASINSILFRITVHIRQVIFKKDVFL